MSVTIESTPQDYNPSDNILQWTFSSTLTAQPNFAFIVEVYVNATLIKEELVFLENGIYGKFNAMEIASNSCSAPVITNGFTSDAENNAEIYIRVVEYYGTTPTKQGGTNSSPVTVWKAGLEYFDWIDFDATDYIVGASGIKWLTNFDGGYTGDKHFPKVARTDEQARLMLINDENDLTNFKIDLYKSGGLVASWNTGTLSLSANKISMLNLSPEVIIANTTLTSANFEASIYMVISSTEMDAYRFDLDSACLYPRAKRIQFLTQIGSVEGFTFELVSNYSASVKSYGYQRVPGSWDGRNYEYSKTKGLNINYIKQVTPRLELVSNWIEEIIQHWLVKNLYSSVLVFEEIDGDLIERSISTASYSYKYNQNQMLFQEMPTLILPSHTTMNL